MPMPYTLTRGPILTLLENALNPVGADGAAARDRALAELRAGAPLEQVLTAGVPDAVATAVPQDALDVRLARDWIGAPGADPGTPTGYWVGYQGDVDAVLREGLVRAIEVSLGIDHGADPATATRAWPVQVDWKCPNPYFETWVTWRRHGQAGGQVNLLIATPPDRSNRLTTKPRQPPPPPPGVPPEPIDAPDQASTAQGMWLVAHETHVPHTVDELLDVETGRRIDLLVDVATGLLGLPAGQWAVPMPSTFWEDTGEAVVVAPPSYAGGADPARSNA